MQVCARRARGDTDGRASALERTYCDRFGRRDGVREERLSSRREGMGVGGVDAEGFKAGKNTGVEEQVIGEWFHDDHRNQARKRRLHQPCV